MITIIVNVKHFTEQQKLEVRDNVQNLGWVETGSTFEGAASLNDFGSSTKFRFQWIGPSCKPVFPDNYCDYHIEGQNIN